MKEGRDIKKARKVKRAREGQGRKFKKGREGQGKKGGKKVQEGQVE